MKTGVLKASAVKAGVPTLKNFLAGLLFGLLVVLLVFSTVGCSKRRNVGAPGFAAWTGWGSSYQGGPVVGLYVGNSYPLGLQFALQLNSIPASPQQVWANGQVMVQYGGIACQEGIQDPNRYLPEGYWPASPSVPVGTTVNDQYGPYGVYNLSTGSNTSNGVVKVVYRNSANVGPNLSGAAGLDFINGNGGEVCNVGDGFDEMYGQADIYLNGQLCLKTDFYYQGNATDPADCL